MLRQHSIQGPAAHLLGRNGLPSRALCASLLLIVTVTACQQAPDAGAPESATDETPTETISTAEDSAGDASTTPAAEPVQKATEPVQKAEETTAPVASGVFLALDNGGIQAVNAQNGSINVIAFGSDMALASKVATAALGAPESTAENGECPAGPLAISSWDNGFSLVAADGQFVGWSANSPTADLTTVAGIGVGSTLSSLENAYDIEVFESTLGTEFSAGQMSGILSSIEPDGVITNLWAGTVCNFR